MKTARIKTMIVIVFALTLGAGVVLGNLVDLRQLLLGSGPARAGHNTLVDDSPLGEELGLTADQRFQMKAIWEDVYALSDKSLRDSRKAQNARDRAIQGLIPRDKLDEYNTINSEYDKEVATIKGSRDKSFNDAVKKTREILTPEQREKYEKILARRLGAEYSGGHDSNGSSAVTQPGS